MTKNPLLAIAVLLAFILNTFSVAPVHAQSLVLPKPGTMVPLSASYNPNVLKGLKVYANDPFKFDFVLDQGDNNSIDVQEDSIQLIKYFLAGLTVPEGDLWVNLSPYEKDRIVPEAFGQTAMGRDLLAQDYILKQITSSVIYPESKTGQEFWSKVYAQAKEKLGTAEVPVNTFNKVWIVPDQAAVWEGPVVNGQATAYITKATFKVMLEEDYLSIEKHQAVKDVNKVGSQVVRDVVIPLLEKEVNEGANFAQLRQIYYSLILSTWYKKKIKGSIIANKYVDQEKINGIKIDDLKAKEKIFQQYVQAFKKGVYNYIKEEPDPVSGQMVPRKYFSGGAKMKIDLAMTSGGQAPASPKRGRIVHAVFTGADAAMTAREHIIEIMQPITAKPRDSEGAILFFPEQVNEEQMLRDLDSPRWKEKPVRNGVHIGTGDLMTNLDIMAHEQSFMGVLAVNGAKTQFILEYMEGILANISDGTRASRELFVSNLTSILKMVFPKDYHPTLESNLQQLLSNPLSWMGNDDYFNHIRLMFKAGDIHSFNWHFNEAEGFDDHVAQKIRAWLKIHQLHVDTIYAPQTVLTEPLAKSLFAFGMPVMSDMRGTVFINSGGSGIHFPLHISVLDPNVRQQAHDLQSPSQALYGYLTLMVMLEGENEVPLQGSHEDLILRLIKENRQVLAEEEKELIALEEKERLAKAELSDQEEAELSSLRKKKQLETGDEQKIAALEEKERRAQVYLTGPEKGELSTLRNKRPLAFEVERRFIALEEKRAVVTIADFVALMGGPVLWLLKGYDKGFGKMRKNPEYTIMDYFEYMQEVGKQVESYRIGFEVLRDQKSVEGIQEVIRTFDAFLGFIQRVKEGKENLSTVDKHEFALAPVLGSVVTSFLTPDLEDNKRIGIGLSPIPSDLMINGDVHKLTRVFENMIKNAIEAILARREKGWDGLGQVNIQVIDLVDNVHIDIGDNGLGIEPADQPKLFREEFTTKAKGTGLGLAACKEIIVNHRGTVSFVTRYEHEASKGTVFTINLPKHDVILKDPQPHIIMAASATEPFSKIPDASIEDLKVSMRPETDEQAFVQQVYRVLKPNGIALVVEGNSEQTERLRRLFQATGSQEVDVQEDEEMGTVLRVIKTEITSQDMVRRVLESVKEEGDAGKPDSAMINNGGIDLNALTQRLKVKGGSLRFDQVALDRMLITGLSPVVIETEPLISLPAFMNAS